MIIVTGGAGFIGSNLVKTLNDSDCEDILIVDDLKQSEKIANLRGLKFYDYMDKDRFIARMEAGGKKFGAVDVIFHNGACSDTMELDGRYMMDTNYEHSKILLHFCQENKISFIYASSASVYGGGDKGFREALECENPLNPYAYSKWLFDQYVRKLLPQITCQVVGLRYFNVFGPQENHKGKMASIAWQLYHQVKSTGVARLFEGTDGYGHGEQLRDFIYVKDVVRVNRFFWEHPEISGVFNCGTGEAHSFNDVAKAVIAQKGTGRIEYIPFPPALGGRYQSYTQADATLLRGVGFDQPFTPLVAAVGEYCACLEQTDGYLK